MKCVIKRSIKKGSQPTETISPFFFFFKEKACRNKGIQLYVQKKKIKKKEKIKKSTHDKTAGANVDEYKQIQDAFRESLP